MLVLCLWYVYCKFMVCFRHACGMFMECLWKVQGLFLGVCLLYVYGVFMVR